MTEQIPSPDECQDDPKALTETDTNKYVKQLTGWLIEQVEGVNTLTKEYKFRDFASALEFTNKVGAIAEEVDHHPQIVTEWGAVTLRWWSHNIKGLRLMDFALAKRCDQDELN